MLGAGIGFVATRRGRVTGTLTVMPWAIWGIAAVATAGVIVRPFAWPEFVWAVTGAALLLVLGLLSPAEALTGLAKGTDVYLFLTGMMLLAELARQEGLFDWLAARAAVHARGSAPRLFGLVFVVGTIVTVFLSNDATAVVLTPAVAAVMRTAKVKEALPYLLVCAFIANAASFLLPTSNPANLVVFGRHLPALGPWVAAFGLSSLAAIVLTYFTLRLLFARSLRARYHATGEEPPVPAHVPIAGFAVGAAALALIVAAALHTDVGITALAGGIACTAIVGARDRGAVAFVARHVSWQVLPLVAGLFVVVAALDRAGAVDLLRAALTHAQHAGPIAGNLEIGGLVTAACALFNNLPVALAAGLALNAGTYAAPVSHAALVAVDLGPNLSVTGSLATLLWLIALRREGIAVTPLQFLAYGVLVTVPALAAAVLLAR